MRQWSILRKFSNWMDLYHNLLNRTQYTEKNILSIINSYGLISNGNFKDKSLNLQTDPNIQQSLTLLLKLMPKLQIHELVILCQNTAKVNISHPIWTEIEKRILINVTELNAREILVVVESLAKAKRKNEKLWETLEVILNEIFLLIQNFEASQLVNLYFSFKSAERGSDLLFENLAKGLCRKTDDFSGKDLEKLSQCLIGNEKIDEKFLRLILSDTIKIIPQLNANQVTCILALFSKNRVSGDYLEVIEVSFEKFLYQHTLKNFARVSHMYGVYLDQEIKVPGKRQEFLLNIERFLDQNKEFLNGKNKFEVFKLMWGISRTGVFEKRTLWQWYLDSFNGQRLDIPGFEEFLKEMKKNKFNLLGF